MTAPILAREGARLGGVTTTTIAAVCRTDSNGARLRMRVYNGPARKTQVAVSPDVTLNAGNNYQGTCYVTGLTAGRQYWYAMEADDGGAGVTVGAESGEHAGTFWTIPASPDRHRMILTSCDISSPTAPGRKEMTGTIFSAWLRHASPTRMPTYCCNVGDVYYSDSLTEVDNGAYAVGSWYNPGTDHAAATLAKYRTNYISNLAYLRDLSAPNRKAQFYSNVPTCYISDDHEYYNACDDRVNKTGAEATRWVTARQANVEQFLSLNKPIIDREDALYGTARSWNPASSWDDDLVVDIPPVRYIVMATREFRNRNNLADSVSKTYLGAAQKQRVLDRIRTNPQKFLVIVSPSMLDGNHGWDWDPNDVWRGFSYERDEILDYLWSSNNPVGPGRTVLYSGDTHEGAVLIWKYGQTPIYEICAGAGMFPLSPQGYINGLQTGATGRGAEMVIMRLFVSNMCLVEATATSMRISLIETQDQGRCVWSRVYR